LLKKLKDKWQKMKNKEELKERFYLYEREIHRSIRRHKNRTFLNWFYKRAYFP